MATSGEQSVSGIGAVSVVTAVGNPAAGADWSFVVPATRQLICVTALLTTAVAVANRTPQLKLATATPVTIVLSPLAPAQVASLADTYVWFPGAPLSAAAAATITAPIPTVTLAANSTIGTVTAGIQAADQWSAIVLTFAG